MKNNPKILIIGASGLIGQAVVNKIPQGVPWSGTSRQGEEFLNCNIEDGQSVEKAFKETSPDVVIHCANQSGGVLYCQQYPEVAKAFHYEGTLNVARMCRKYRAKFVYISTECVFDGAKEEYSEGDALSPLSEYGQYKAQSERWIEKNLDKYNIVRTMFVFGWQPQTKTPNAMMKVYQSIQQKRPIRIPAYRWGSPTYVEDLASAIVELSLSDAKGIYHVTGTTYLNRYEWMKKLCQALEWDESFVLGDHHPEEPAVYPQKIRLNTQKFVSQFKTKLHSLEESLEDLKKKVNV